MPQYHNIYSPNSVIADIEEAIVLLWAASLVGEDRTLLEISGIIDQTKQVKSATILINGLASNLSVGLYQFAEASSVTVT